MLNFYILAYIAVSLACMATLVLVMVRQFKEVRRPKNGFTSLRWQLFWLPTVILAGLLLGMPRLFTSLHAHYDGGQLLRVIGGIIMLIGITLLILGIYTYREKN